MVFCYIIKENYSEAIYYLKSNKSKDKNNLKIIKCYLIQCYIYLNKIEQAKKISEEIISDDENIKENNTELKFYERLNSRLISVKGFKINILLNLIKMCAITKKIREMQKYLICILDSIKFNISFDQERVNCNEEIPTYIINVFVYYYLIIGRKDLALDILKKRKIKEILITAGNN